MEWSESVDIDAPPAHVFEAMLDQNTVMKWSAWPEATGFSCRVAGDGRSVGSQIVFADAAGSEQGRQTISAIGDWVVSNELRNKGPRGSWVEPRVRFRVEEQGSRSLAILDFEVHPPVPRLLLPVANRYLKRTVRPLHVEDLRRLKALMESGPVRDDVA